MLSNKEIELYYENVNKFKRTCKHCNHKTIIPQSVDKQICGWCGHYVYRNDDIERGGDRKEKEKSF